MKIISQLKKNDIVGLKYGAGRLNAVILKNLGDRIIWRSLDWKRCYSESFTYKQCQTRKVIYLGRYRPIWKRLTSLNFSDVEI